MYLNLECELKRKNITRQKIADDFHWNIATVSQKLTKIGRMRLNEAYLIRDAYFPQLDIEYLFEWQDNSISFDGFSEALDMRNLSTLYCLRVNLIIV